MKKTLCILIIALLFVTTLLTGCGNNSSTPDSSSTMSENTSTPGTSVTQAPNTSPNPTNTGILGKTCKEIIEYICSNVEQTDYLESRTRHAQFTDVTSDTCEWFLGKENISFKEATALESPISPSDYSMVIVKLNDGDDHQQIEQTITDHISPTKWVCMGADVARVVRVDNVILVVISDKKTADDMAALFQTLTK